MSGLFSVQRRWFRFAAYVALAFLTIVQPALADIKDAYQREFAFLEAEKHSLKQRLGTLDQQTAEKVAAANAEVDQLQGRALSLSLSAERMTEMLTDVERQVDTTGEDQDLVDSLLTQAAAQLEKGAVELPEPPKDGQADIQQLQFAFDSALVLLDRHSSVRKEQGEFFGEDGEKVEGMIIRVGQIASFGVADNAAGALAPAGGAMLKVWPGVESGPIARSLAAGEQPGLLKLFLYESLDNGVDRKKDKTVREVVDSGGVIGWVIVAIGLVALLMALIRTLLLFTAAANTDRLVATITPLVERKELDRAIELCAKARNSSGRVLRATLKNLHRPRHELEDIISEAVLHETPTLDRFGSMIIVIAAVAPLLGLLGTVTGMIATFDIITEFGTGNPKLLSGGISIALVTTELGLIVAIPALVIGNLLSGWAESIKDAMDKAALRVVNVAAGIRLRERPTTAPDIESKGQPSEPVAAT